MKFTLAVLMLSMVTSCLSPHKEGQVNDLKNKIPITILHQEDFTSKLKQHINETEKKIKKDFEKNKQTGYVTENVNIRQKPSIKSTSLGVYLYGNEIEYVKYNNKWVCVKYKNKFAYIYSKYVTNELKYHVFEVPYNNHKSFMGYDKITSSGSPQLKLQNCYAYTGNYGIRQVNRRYCIAVGSAFTTEIGQYIDLILENGKVIPCVLGDQKADKDTNDSNTITVHDGSAVEFVVDEDALASRIWKSGDVSSAAPSWDSPVKYIKVYGKNIFE